MFRSHCLAFHIFHNFVLEMSLLSYIKTIVRAGKDLELNFCCFYFHQMAKGLSYCHQSGLVHGDIKRKYRKVSLKTKTIKNCKKNNKKLIKNINV